jgi:hypothetical protein
MVMPTLVRGFRSEPREGFLSVACIPVGSVPGGAPGKVLFVSNDEPVLVTDMGN